jgi:hypothetical protein
MSSKGWRFTRHEVDVSGTIAVTFQTLEAVGLKDAVKVPLSPTVHSMVFVELFWLNCT